MTQQVGAIFLSGILMPAKARYAPLRSELRGGRRTLTKELEVYGGAEPPSEYSLRTEVDGLERFADEHSLDKFHLYGYSAGASVALGYVTEHPGRVVSLAVDEPASDFSDEDRQAIAADLPDDLEELPVPERFARFTRSCVRDGVELPPPSAPPSDPEMAKRPAGLSAFSRALSGHRLDHAALRAFRRPVYFSYGSLSHQRWEAMAQRFKRELVRCRVERFDGVHHLHTAHQAQPVRVAAALERLWADAETDREGWST